MVQASAEVAVLSGMFVFLKSTATGKLVEVDGADVKAKSSGQGAGAVGGWGAGEARGSGSSRGCSSGSRIVYRVLP